MKLLKNKKNLVSVVAALVIFISSFGSTVFATTKTTNKKLSNRQITTMVTKAYDNFNELSGIGTSQKTITINDFEYYKVKEDFKNSTSFFSYLEKKTGIDKYFSKNYRDKIMNSMVIMYKGEFYIEAGDPEFGLEDYSSATVKSKKYSGKTMTVTLSGKNYDGGTDNTTLILTYENNKWVVSDWADLNKTLRID